MNELYLKCRVSRDEKRGGLNLHESCGVFGVYSPSEDVARLTFFALFALQHRGQESSGIATADGRKIRVYAGMGRVSNVFNEDSLGRLGGHIAIGHNRYSTAGSSRAGNAQPIVVGDGANTIAIAHNGNIINATYLYEELVDATGRAESLDTAFAAFCSTRPASQFRFSGPANGRASRINESR